MSTVSFAVSAVETTTKNRRDLLKSTFNFADISAFDLAYRKLARGETFALDFSSFVFCSVNIPTLIQLHIGSSSVEMTIRSTLVLSNAGRIVFVNPPNNTVLLPVDIRYLRA